ncbi:MAG: agmatinase [Thermofilum sp.]
MLKTNPELEMFTRRLAPPLFGRESKPEESRLIVVGAPFDSSATTVPGQRAAPRRIREISLELETFDFELEMDAEDAPFYDAGDLPLEVDFSSFMGILYRVASEVFSKGKILALIGGDHLVTLPSVKAALSTLGTTHLLVLDAHLDLRDEYPLGTKYSHATVMRRLLEENSDLRITYFKPRALSKEEYSFLASCSRVRVVRRVEELLEDFESSQRIYLSIDIDVVDPAFAPGVGVPEPLGLYPQEVAQVLDRFLEAHGRRVIGFDLVEVNPVLDVSNVTSALAAKLLMKIIVRIFKLK